VRSGCAALFLAALALFTVACQPSPTDSGAGSQQDVREQSRYWDAWQKSPHAHTYDLEKGPNTYCARCHSPRNWDAQATIGKPPNCVSCKFPFEDEPRISPDNPLVSRSEWQDIRCNVCHRMQDGVAGTEVVWWEQEAGSYKEVADNTMLCQKCHTNTDVLRHRRGVGQPAHPDFECTSCHDAHSTRADCRAEGCHPGLATDVPEVMHDSAHDSLSCVACHDAQGLEVGPLEDGTVWVTWRTTELLGRSTTEPYQSHAITREVDCQRCHHAGNPWELNPVEGAEE